MCTSALACTYTALEQITWQALQFNLSRCSGLPLYMMLAFSYTQSTLIVPDEAILAIENPALPTSVRLPDEILNQIATYALDQAFCNLDVATTTSGFRKPLFSCIEGMSRSSRRLRVVALSEWFRLFLVQDVKDWIWASRLKGLHSWVSTGLGTQEPDTSNFDLEDGYYGQIADGSECLFWGAFPFDHNIYFGGEGVEAYADELAAELEPLRNLEEISLGVYLTPHDSLAEHRLSHYPWRHLETTQVAMNTTQPVNSPNIPPGHAATIASATPPLFPFSTSQLTPPSYANPALWSYDCKACRKLYAEPTSNAERAAGLVLAKKLHKLKQIEWASFFESRPPTHSECALGQQDNLGYRRGTGSHKWRVIRDEAGALLDLVQV
ncbi:unnamed protein product [Rhizoctonia solani]|uniref:Uncharacterized protein n=1 Tax=Rhizoctonia solani TaxID=456999 RepID=A0A8H3A111_9AGAM|nr:unnamed protein product [Rhizoctonia solani]